MTLMGRQEFGDHEVKSADGHIPKGACSRRLCFPLNSIFQPGTGPDYEHCQRRSTHHDGSNDA